MTTLPGIYQLNPRQPAWNLETRRRATTEIAVPAASEWRAGTFTIPGADETISLGFRGTVRGVAIELLAIGGRKLASATKPDWTIGDNSRSYGGSFHEIPFRVDVKEGDAASVTTISSALPHLLLSIAGLDANHVLIVRVHDDRGREVPVHQEHCDRETVIFMKTEGDVRSIEVTFRVIQPVVVEA